MPPCKTGCLATLLGGFKKDKHADEARNKTDHQKIEKNNEEPSTNGPPGSEGPANVIQTTEVRQVDGTPAIDDRTITGAHHEQRTTDQVASIHKALWDKAYSNLKNDSKKAEYVSRYEELLAKVFLNQSTAGEAVETNDSLKHLGEEQMKKVVEEGLARIEKYKKAIEHSESTVNVIKQVKAILDIPLKNVSQTALPWAVISSSVDILLKPVIVGKALYNGVGYAVSRIEWYSKLTNKLLCEDSITDEKTLHGIREDIAGRITSLYESLLFYQIKSVCFYYKKYQLLVWARGLLKLDDWSDDLKQIQEAEDALARDCALYNMEQLKDQMRAMIMDTETEKASQKYQDRLQSIRRVDPQATVKTIESLKESVMDDLYTWVFDTEQFKGFMSWEKDAPRRLWISGQAGTGKTMLSIGTIRELQTWSLKEPEPPTILYFFCQNADVDLNNGVAVLQSLVWMLLRQQPHLGSHLDEQFSHSGQKFISDSNCFATWCDILTSMLRDSNRIIVAIDALDECAEGSRRQLLRFLSGMVTKERMFHVKWFITSRPLLEIPDSRPGTVLQYHRLLTSDDQNLTPWINAYIDRKVQAIRDKAKNQERVDSIRDQLHERASNTYIWVSLVFGEIENAPEAQWQKIIEHTPSKLNDLYSSLLRQLPWPECKTVLSVAMVARRPLSLWEIEQLTGMETGVNAGRDYVTACRSFLTIRGETAYFIHQSAQDWLLSNQQQLRDGSPQDPGVIEKNIHREIFENSLKGMMETLKENIYQLPHYGVGSCELKTPSQDPLAAIRYSCQYWAYHLKESELRPYIDMFGFLRQHFLHWLEALALMKIVPETVGIIDILRSIAAVTLETGVHEFLLDAKRFVWRHQQLIMNTPLQAYVSALLFTPKASLVRKTRKLPKWIDRGPSMEKEWGPLLKTFTHFGNGVGAMSVSWSPDDQLIAGFRGNILRIWNAGTGHMIKKIELKKGFEISLWKVVTCVKFTSDGQLLLGLNMHRVYVWDTATWKISRIVECPGVIKGFAVSPNSQLLACLQNNGKIHLWQRNGTSWSTKWTYKSSDDSPALAQQASLSFSYDSRLLASIIDLDCIVILDTEHGELQEKIMAAHWWKMNAIKFSRDGKLLLQTHDSVEIWRHKDKWEIDRKIELVNPCTNLAISPDDRLIALPGSDSAIRIVDREGMVVQILGGHTSEAYDLAFSSDGQFLVSGGSDETIRLWGITLGKYDKALVEHYDSIGGVALSADGSLLVTARHEGVIETWSGETGEYQRTLEAPSSSGSDFDLAVSPDNKLVAWASQDGLVMMWNAETGQTVGAHKTRRPPWDRPSCRQFQFSSNSKLLGWVDTEGTLQVWRIRPWGLLESPRRRQEELSLIFRTLQDKYMSGETEHSPDDRLYSNVTTHTPRVTIQDDWVVLGEQKIIWLPPEYRPWRSHGGWDAQNSILVVGLESGRFYSIRFNLHEMSAG